MKIKIRKGILQSEALAGEGDLTGQSKMDPVRQDVTLVQSETDLTQPEAELTIPPAFMGLEELYSSIRQDFGEMLRLNIYLGEDISQIRQRERLRRELRKCGTGDWQAKA